MFVCVLSKKQERGACVSQNTCSSGNIQRAARVLPVHPVIISSRDHSAAQRFQSHRCLIQIFLFLSFFLRSFFSPQTSAAVTRATERRFEFGCMQNVHIKLHKLLPFFYPLFCRLPSSLRYFFFSHFFPPPPCLPPVSPRHFYPCVTGLKRPV